MLTLIDFFERCHVRRFLSVPHRAAHHLPLSPAGLYIFSQFPQTLTAAGAEVWVGAHYFFVEPCQKEGRVFKRSKVRFSFLGYFISYGQIRPSCDLFHVSCVCATSSLLRSPHHGNNFRSPSFNELPSWLLISLK